MSPAEKLGDAARLYWAARRLREAAVRQIHPEWSEAEVKAHVRRIFLRAGT